MFSISGPHAGDGARPRAICIVRYADDTVIGFEHEADARRFWDAMRERLRGFSPTLHPDKTRLIDLIEFGRFAAQKREKRGLPKPETLRFSDSEALTCSPMFSHRELESAAD